MLAQHAKKVHDLAVYIVQNIGFWTQGAAQEHAAHAAEGLGMAAIWDRGDAFGEVFLAAQPWGKGFGRGDDRQSAGISCRIEFWHGQGDAFPLF